MKSPESEPKMWVPLLALPLLIGGALNELGSFNFFICKMQYKRIEMSSMQPLGTVETDKLDHL